MASSLYFEQLLAAYQTLWLNRSFLSQTELTSEQKLTEAMLKDLRDEMTHPRVRKTPYVKYHIAVRRIIESNLDQSDKVNLITMYTNLLEECI
ncbi:hypothetical protein FZC66_12495 [Priestia megaterium]|nr:hypothetical protein FZC66_12495 [Priestia megaterium]